MSSLMGKLFKKTASDLTPSTDSKTPAISKEDAAVAKVATDAKAVFAGTVIVRQVVTEKSVSQKKNNVTTFIVARTATKSEVAATIFRLFKVKPLKVNVVRNTGKAVRFGRFAGKRQDTKKAFVFLKENQTIALPGDNN